MYCYFKDPQKNRLVKLLSDPFLNDIEVYELKKYLSGLTDFSDILVILVKNRIVGIAFYNIMKYDMLFKIDKRSREVMNSIVTHDTLKYNEYCMEMQRITRSLSNYKIPYALMKGINIIEKLYKLNCNYIVRSFNDIDILVEKKDVTKVVELLRCNGYIQGHINYRTKEYEPVPREKILYWSLTSHQEYPMIKKNAYSNISPLNTFIVDINHTFFNGGMEYDPIETKRILENRMEESTGNNIKYWGLSREHELLQLIFHYYKDSKSHFKKNQYDDKKIINLMDIYLFISKYFDEINWIKLKEEVYEASLQKIVFQVLKTIIQFKEESEKIREILYHYSE